MPIKLPQSVTPTEAGLKGLAQTDPLAIVRAAPSFTARELGRGLEALANNEVGPAKDDDEATKRKKNRARAAVVEMIGDLCEDDPDDKRLDKPPAQQGLMAAAKAYGVAGADALVRGRIAAERNRIAAGDSGSNTEAIGAETLAICEKLYPTEKKKKAPAKGEKK